jgi:hypothetical protein
VEPFYFTPFGTKRLQTAPEATGEAMPNGALVRIFLFGLVELVWQSMHDFASSTKTHIPVKRD